MSPSDPSSLPDDFARLSTAPPPGSPVPVADAPIIPGYEILGRLGRGGMGQVYKARQIALDRLVALKVIRPDHKVDTYQLRRFQREMKAGGRLLHPNIVTFYDADCVGNVPFLTMEYVEGEDLGLRVKRDGPLDVVAACDAARQAALGLHHAHECGLIHRDVKPSNLLLRTDGVVKLLDLGLARLESVARARRAARLVLDGVVAGALFFLSLTGCGVFVVFLFWVLVMFVISLFK